VSEGKETQIHSHPSLKHPKTHPTSPEAPLTFTILLGIFFSAPPSAPRDCLYVMLEKVKKTLSLGSETRAEKMNITLLDIK